MIGPTPHEHTFDTKNVGALGSQLGAGGMGEVYLAVDTELDRTVALKILPQEFVSDRRRLQRFIQEAKSVSALNHPHILTIFEIGQADHVRFIATEFIDGDTLRQRIRNGSLEITRNQDGTAFVPTRGSQICSDVWAFRIRQ